MRDDYGHDYIDHLETTQRILKKMANFQSFLNHDVTLHLKNKLSFRGTLISYKDFTFHLESGIDNIYIIGEVVAITQHGMEH